MFAYALLKVAENQSLSSGLRAYAGTAKAHYSIRDVLRWAVYHAGELALAVGVIPACALIVLLGLFRARWQATAAERAYLAVALAAIPLILLEVGAFASRFSLRVEERNMLYLEPLLLLALVVWLARGMPRPPGLVSVGVAISVGLLITLPFETLFNVSAETTPSVSCLLRLSEALNGGVSSSDADRNRRDLRGDPLRDGPADGRGLGDPDRRGRVPDLSSGSVWAKETYIARRPALRAPATELDRPRRGAAQARRVPLHDRHRSRSAHPLAVGVLEPQPAPRLRRDVAGREIPDVTAPLNPRPEDPAGAPCRFTRRRPGYVVAASNLASRASGSPVAVSSRSTG